MRESILRESDVNARYPAVSCV